MIDINGENFLRYAVTPLDFQRDNAKTYNLHPPTQQRCKYNLNASQFSRCSVVQSKNAATATSFSRR